MRRMNWIWMISGILLVTSMVSAAETAAHKGPGNPHCSNNVAEVVSRLNSLRSALSVYYGDHEGAYPTDLQQLIPKYLPAIPTIQLCDSKKVVHPATNRVENFSSRISNDAGGWGYVNSMASVGWGDVFVNCVHESPAGPSWISY